MIIFTHLCFHFLPFSIQTLIFESIFFSHLFQYIFKLYIIFMVVTILHKYLPALIENIFSLLWHKFGVYMVIVLFIHMFYCYLMNVLSAKHLVS